MKSILIVSVFVLFISIVSADDTISPVLSDPYPADGSYISGGDRTFSINITEENLDIATAKLNIKSRDAAGWDTYSLSCADRSGIWYCTVTVSLDIVGSDTTEQYYFEANDTSDNYGNYASADNPLTTTVDINPPVIVFQSPSNNSWVSSTQTISLSVEDVSSGVNESSVKYSFNNVTWLDLDSEYQATWDTTSYSDGTDLKIHAKALDDLGNLGYGWINATVDNEDPAVTIVSPTANQTLTGITSLVITTTDSFSGIDTSDVKYVIQSTERTMDCVASGTGYSCDEYLDTTQFSDGSYSLNFNVYDNAGNLKQESTTINIDNTRSSLSITSPNDNSCVNGQVIIYSRITNPSTEITDVKFKWQSTTATGSWESMSCDSNYNCSISWDTSTKTEGKYTLKVNATGTMDYSIGDQISITIDNTKPLLYIQQPTGSYIEGVFYPKVTVTDEYLVDPSSVKFEIEGAGSGLVDMNCLKQTQGKKYICTGNYNSSSVEDSAYSLRFVAADQAGNSNSTTKNIIVNNLGSTETTVSDEAGQTSSDQTTTTSSVSNQKKNLVTMTKEKVNTIFQKVRTEKYIMISIAVLITIGFLGYYLLVKPSKQKIEIEENEIQ